MVPALVIASSVPKITCESLMADCTGLVQKILSHLRKEFYVQICPLKVGATGPHKLGNLSIWDEMSKDGKDHRITARRNTWNIINLRVRGCWYIRQMDLAPQVQYYYYYSTRNAFWLTEPLQTVAIWQRHVDRVKHRVQLKFDSGSSSLGAVFF